MERQQLRKGARADWACCPGVRRQANETAGKQSGEGSPSLHPLARVSETSSFLVSSVLLIFYLHRTLHPYHMHKRVYQVWLSYSLLLGVFFGGGVDNILYFVSWDRVSLCSPDCPWSPNLIVSASQNAGAVHVRCHAWQQTFNNIRSGLLNLPYWLHWFYNQVELYMALGKFPAPSCTSAPSSLWVHISSDSFFFFLIVWETNDPHSFSKLYFFIFHFSNPSVPVDRDGYESWCSVFNNSLYVHLIAIFCIYRMC